MVVEFVVFGVAALVGLVLWEAHRAHRRRTAQIQAVADTLGLAYEARSTERLEKLVQFRPIREGRGGSPRAHHVLRGDFKGHAVRWFEFVYTVHTGKSSHDEHRAVALAQLPQPYPEVVIVPETLGHKVWDALGGEDIDFESDEFSRRFWVTAGDRRFAYDLIHPGLMEFLLALEPTRWHLCRDMLCFWIPRRVRPTEIEPMLDAVASFLGRFPRHLGSAPAART